MKRYTLTLALEDLQKKLTSFQEAYETYQEQKPSEPYAILCFDALMKRFENLFVMTLNFLKISLSKQGIDVLSPRACIQEGVRLSWINEPDIWLMAMDLRGTSINGFLDLKPREIMNVTSQFAIEIEILMNLIQELYPESEK